MTSAEFWDSPYVTVIVTQLNGANTCFGDTLLASSLPLSADIISVLSLRKEVNIPQCNNLDSYNEHTQIQIMMALLFIKSSVIAPPI